MRPLAAATPGLHFAITTPRLELAPATLGRLRLAAARCPGTTTIPTCSPSPPPTRTPYPTNRRLECGTSGAVVISKQEDGGGSVAELHPGRDRRQRACIVVGRVAKAQGGTKGQGWHGRRLHAGRQGHQGG